MEDGGRREEERGWGRRRGEQRGEDGEGEQGGGEMERRRGRGWREGRMAERGWMEERDGEGERCRGRGRRRREAERLVKAVETLQLGSGALQGGAAVRRRRAGGRGAGTLCCSREEVQGWGWECDLDGPLPRTPFTCAHPSRAVPARPSGMICVSSSKAASLSRLHPPIPQMEK